MRRADRLFRIVQILRARRFATARMLADTLEVSERTVYRDVQDLSLSGVPIEGEAGVGYRLRSDYDLPPIMFDYAEIEALTAGARMVQAWSSPKLARAAQAALEKIAAALPLEKRLAIERTPLHAPTFHIDKALGITLDAMRDAVMARHRLTFAYRDEGGKPSRRTVRPLGLYFWGQRWTLAAWCESREDFRNFRLDRVTGLVTGKRFPDEEGKRLQDFLRSVGA
ncbi:DNA-binding transcriptional regulator [Betaproteobacteria bacterium GR16-43]|nr:DNA-binding transcriptional regulator [Betaproteobacteria bacterium GR16-43]